LGRIHGPELTYSILKSPVGFPVLERKIIPYFFTMNFLETILILNEAVVLIFFFRKNGNHLNALLALFLAIIITLIHFLTEGYRFTMVPAYLFLTGIYIWHRMHPDKPMGNSARIGFVLWWAIGLILPLL